MFGPSMNTTHLVNHRHNERLEHSARIQMIASHRHDTQRAVTQEGARRNTVARLAASVSAAATGLAHTLTGSPRARAQR